MVASDYVPENADLVWLDFTSQAGHEQKGRRPAICISQKNITKKQDWLYSARLQAISKVILLKLYWTIILSTVAS